ncbi:MAG TPA: bifunctional pyr operon transcriptional regulator/uracil phosphoribosyltransferase PyrR [Blastocatellia bacterium]|nr:bifunctional pyr operon transcriptional regulator/uracil phosphoribosyltransferase PyrR [Blastocatellia bacterium]
MKEKTILMTATDIRRVISRLASRIIADHPRNDEIILLGIRTRGVPLAERLARKMAESHGVHVPVGALDITFYRDDLSRIAPHPIVKKTDLPLDITDRTVILVDDVLYTGRTIRAALDHLMDYGRPQRVRLVVLVDRGHRELPICPDYVGKTITTEKGDIVHVMLAESDGVDQVVLVRQGEKHGFIGER